MSKYNFKKIAVVPSAKDFIDIILSKTQRKTPTVVHKQYQITRIRNFYLRKIKFAQQSFHDRLSQILEEFPRIDKLNPFYRSLINTVYEREHYKVALSQINTASHLIDTVAKDYVRLMKYGDSLYRCKQLKRAALGRMATIMKRQAESLSYLEDVRQGLARLPSIDAEARTLLICGFPNVGKSSFINKITNADVEVQPYAFTTKALYVGHTDYKYLRWQVIDTPGILDRPLEERNLIEMQAINALMHLKSCVLYFMDPSEECGRSLEEQVKLFNSLNPLFEKKPLIVVVNKIDLVKLDDLSPEKRAVLKDIEENPDITILEMSTLSDAGIMDVRNEACEKLLSFRIEQIMRSKKVDDKLNLLQVSMPKPRDKKLRPPCIPESVLIKQQKNAEKRKRKQELMDVDQEIEEEEEQEETVTKKRKLERDIEEEQGDDYILDLKKIYSEIPEQERWDVIPEIWEGHNIADYIDKDILDKLAELEKEEEAREEVGMYVVPKFEFDLETHNLARKIKFRKAMLKDESRINKQSKKPTMPRTAAAHVRGRTATKLRKDMEKLEVDMSGTKNAHFTKTKKKAKNTGVLVKRNRMDVDAPSTSGVVRKQAPPRNEQGVKDVAMRKKLHKIAHRAIAKKVGKMGLKGEADRFIGNKMPKHLFSGKRGVGKTDRR